jgi:hypothetical protein
MSFKLLKFVIDKLKRSQKCTNCAGDFDDDSIFVLTTTATPEISSAIFFTVCPKCASPAFVLSEVKPATSEFRQDYIRIITKQATGPVSVDDILDMHNFLKNYQGDVQELFK